MNSFIWSLLLKHTPDIDDDDDDDGDGGDDGDGDDDESSYFLNYQVSPMTNRGEQ